MKKDWQQLTRMTQGRSITVERVKIENEETFIEGSFELPPLVKLSAEDQVFVAIFVKCHGSIKQMEKQFGVSYPTIKSRLNRIGDQLDFVEVETIDEPGEEILDRLSRGDIKVEEAIEAIRKKNQ